VQLANTALVSEDTEIIGEEPTLSAAVQLYRSVAIWDEPHLGELLFPFPDLSPIAPIQALEMDLWVTFGDRGQGLQS
jgi:hypothetical protein